MDRNKKMMGEWEQKSLLNELLRGKELAGQLQLTIATSPPSSSSSSSTSSSYESRQNLVQNILVSFEKALSMLNWPGGSSGTSNQSLLPAVPVMIGMSESPPSLTGSPFSDDSDRDQDNKDYIGSRKRWTKQVRVSPGMGLEGPLDDGFSWRKYGQKDILGAKYPRGYYRCTHRNVQGCLATKQVQRSDDDPTIFEITYRARHTCTQAPGHVIGTTTTTTSTASTDQNQNNNNFPSLLEQMSHHQTHQDDHHHNNILSSLRSGLKIITEGLENPHDGQSPPLIISSNNFNFPTVSSSTPLPVNANMIDAVATTTAVVAAAAGENQNPTAADHGRFSSPNYSMIINDMSLMTEFSHHHHHPPSFVSPETSGTNYFSSSAVSPHHHQHHEFGGSSVQQSFDHHNDQHGSESDQIISAIITSTANTTQPIGMEISGHEFDSNFTFDNSGFFS